MDRDSRHFSATAELLVCTVFVVTVVHCLLRVVISLESSTTRPARAPAFTVSECTQNSLSLYASILIFYSTACTKRNYIVHIGDVGNSVEKHNPDSYVFRCLVGRDTDQPMRSMQYVCVVVCVMFSSMLPPSRKLCFCLRLFAGLSVYLPVSSISEKVMD